MASLFENRCKNVNLKRYLRYMELVLDHFWNILPTAPEDLQEIPEVLLTWMKIDCFVGRHSGMRIREWEVENEKKITDVPLTVREWEEQLQSFPGQAILKKYGFFWSEVSQDDKKKCRVLLDEWIKEEGLDKGKGKEKKQDTTEDQATTDMDIEHLIHQMSRASTHTPPRSSSPLLNTSSLSPLTPIRESPTSQSQTSPSTSRSQTSLSIRPPLKRKYGREPS